MREYSISHTITIQADNLEQARKEYNVLHEGGNFREVINNDGFTDITSIHRDDLEAAGFDVSNVEDETMKHIAEDMADDYCTQLYWSSLKYYAGEHGIPLKPEQSENTEESGIASMNEK